MNVFVILNCLKGVYIVKYSNDLMKKYLQTLLHITMRLRVEICLYIITFVSQMGLTALPYFSDPVVEGIASVIGQATLDECTLLIYSSNMDHFHLLRTHPIPRVLLYVRSTHLNKSKLKFPLPFRRAPPCSFNMWYEPSPYARDHFWSRWGDNFLERIPGGIFQSYHLILTSIPGSDYFSTNVPLVVKQMHHCLLLNARCSNSYDLYTPGVWYNESFHVLSYPVPKPRSECLHSDRERSLFFSKWQNYGRYGPLVVATTPDNQQSHVVAYLKTKKVTNYVVVNTVFSTQYLNTTPVMLPLPNGIYGTKDKKTGKWLGMVGELVSGRAHFTSVVGLDYDRSEVIRYTTTVAFDRVNFITPHPRVRHIAGSISFLIFPFTAFVWGATLASFGILWLSLFLDYVIKVNRGQKELQWGPVIYFCAQLLLRPIFDQPSSALSSVMNVSKVKTRSRALYIVWLLVLIVLTSSYKSKMIAVLLKPNQRVPPSTFEELAQSKFTIGAILFNESIFGESFRKLENPISKAILKRIQGYKYMKPDVRLCNLILIILSVHYKKCSF